MAFAASLMARKRSTMQVPVVEHKPPEMTMLGDEESPFGQHMHSSAGGFSASSASPRSPYQSFNRGEKRPTLAFASQHSLGGSLSQRSSDPQSLQRTRSATIALGVADEEVDENERYTLRQHFLYLFEAYPNAGFAELHYYPWYIASKIVGNISFVCILLSIAAFSIETHPEYYERGLLSFFVIETVCVAFFTLDYVVRFACTKNSEKLHFIRQPLNIIDLASIIPYYVDVATSSGGAASGLLLLRTLRLLRILRVLKLSRNNVGIEAVVASIVESQEAIVLLMFLLIIAMIVFSSAMYFAEVTGATYNDETEQWIRDDGTLSPFQSIPHTFWWCIVSMTTVGYGDDVPATPYGKAIAAITMLCGVFVLAFPTVILSSNFQEIHAAKVEEKRRSELEAKLIMARKKLGKRMSAMTASLVSKKYEAPPSLGQRKSDGDKTGAALVLPNVPMESSERAESGGADSKETKEKDAKGLKEIKFVSSSTIMSQSLPSYSSQGIGAVQNIQERMIAVPFVFSGIARLIEFESPVKGQYADKIVAKYTCIPHFLHAEGAASQLQVRVEPCVRGVAVVLTLQLMSDECTQAVKTAIYAAYPSMEGNPQLVIDPTPYRFLKVVPLFPTAVSNIATLSATTFNAPPAVIPIVLTLNDPTALTNFMNNINLLKFRFEGNVADVETHTEPLHKLAGVVAKPLAALFEPPRVPSRPTTPPVNGSISVKSLPMSPKGQHPDKTLSLGT